jgi:ParB/RepB/Spo0J family partition protein
MAAEKIQNVRVCDLVPSPQNPRKHLRGIEDLADSMRSVGVLEPLVARRVAVGAEEVNEIVCGHRRAAAAELAELPTVPVIFREYSDDQVLEVMCIENLQREDVHPLDEADTFQTLLDNGRTVTQVADKIGRAPAYVAQRLALCQLGKEARKALDEDAISIGVAQLIARVPAKLQADAVKYATQHGNMEGHMSVKAARETVVRRFMLRLADAPFDRTDADLVAKAGACTGCPKRTGNQVELFSDVDSPDLCTDPICYRSKNDAHWKRLQDEAKKGTGKPVLSNADCKALFDSYQDEPKYGAAWVALTGEVNDTSYRRHKIKKVLKGHEYEAVLARNPHTGTIHEVVNRKHVDRALKALTKNDAREQQREKHHAENDAANAAARLKRAIDLRTTTMIADALVDAVEADVDGTARTQVLWLILAQLADDATAVGRWVGGRRYRGFGTDNGSDAEKIMLAVDWATRSDEHDVLALIVELIVGCDEAPVLSTETIKARDTLARTLGIDLRAIAKQATKIETDATKPAKPKKPTKSRKAPVEASA